MSAYRMIRMRTLLPLFGVFISLVIIGTAAFAYLNSIRHMENLVEEANEELLRQLNRRLELMLMDIDASVLAFLQTAEARHFFESARAATAQIATEQTATEQTATEQTATARTATEQAASEERARLLATQKKLIELKHTHSHIHSIYLYAGDNRMLTDTTFTEADKFSDMAWLSMIRHPNAFFTWTDVRELWTDFGVRHNVFTLVRPFPLTNQIEQQVGMIVVNVNERLLHLLFSELKLESSIATLVNEDGQFISQNHNGSLLPEALRKLQELQEQVQLLLPEITRSGSGLLRTEVAGDAHWLFYAASDYTRWQWIYLVPERQLDSTYTAIRNTLVGVAALMVGLALCSLFMLNKLTFGPLTRFVRKIEARLGAQDRGEQAAHNGHRTADSLDRLETRFESFVADYAAAERRLRETHPAMKFRTLLDVLTGSKTSYAAALPYLERVNVSLYPAHYVVMTAAFDYPWQADEPHDWQLYTFALTNVAEELMHADPCVCRGTAVQVNATQCAIVLSFAEDEPLANQLAALTIAESIRKFMEQKFRKTVTIGIGKYYVDFGRIQQSYAESAELLNYKLVAGINTVLTQEDLQEHSRQDYVRLFAGVDRILEAVRALQEEEAEGQVHALFDAMVRLSLHRDNIERLSDQLLLKLQQLQSQFGLEAEAVDEFEHEHQHDQQNREGRQLHKRALLERCETIEEMEQVVRTAIRRVLEAVRQKRSGTARSELTRTVKQFIADNYHRPELSQQLAAEQLNISPSYLSRMFKEQTSVNFLQYVIDVRMRAARALLLESALPVQEIALRAGYTNLSSFLRIFKKYYGMTPTELRAKEAPD